MRLVSAAPTVAVVACALGVLGTTTGCATMFRETKTTVQVDSMPAGAEVRVKNEAPQKTPSDLTVKRGGLTELQVLQPGFEEHRGVVRKSVNGWWLLSDIATCVVPVFLCVPLVADAVSGAWNDVQPRYQARLVPVASEPAPLSAFGAPPPLAVRLAPSPPAAASSAAPSPESTMSDSERKAAARAAYQEGVELQAQKSWGPAIEKLSAAQRLFDAPPHLVHLAQCYAASGKLVEAYETYETLTHRTPTRDQPPQFHEAVATGQKEIAELAPRIPTLTIQVAPAPSTLRNLSILVNGRAMPIELVGIPRPVNPGRYEITATAWGIAAAKPITITVAESEKKTADVNLGRAP